MAQSIAILGRQPALGMAELESLYGADKLRPLGEQAALLDLSAEQVDFGRLGGTIKLCKVLTVLPATDWRKLQDHLTSAAPHHLGYLPEGKLKLGLSAYGLNVSAKQLQVIGLTLKKVIREHGRSVRLVPNEEPVLNSAQVLHNKLTGQLGWELVFVADGSQAILAQTVAVQDITAYAKRDQARPKRDARVGMLPPKLAQIIINLAGRHVIPEGATLNQQPRAYGRGFSANYKEGLLRTSSLLDPFCGTGVILQEALLMGYDVCGTDIDPRMVEYSQTNIDWLRERQPDLPGLATITQGDATTHQWPDGIPTLAAETYLGRPLSSLPAPDAMRQIISDVNTIHKKFLENLASQTEPGFRLCLAIPAWKTDNGFKHLPVLDHLTDIGYNRVSFVHASNEELIYHRPNQIVARELVVLTRK